MAAPIQTNPTVRRTARKITAWMITALQVGAVSTAAGLTFLYLNPFWHFDEGGFLDWRVDWWNGAAATLIATGLLITALSLLASAALMVSHFAGRRSWPFAVVALLILCTILWIGASGFVRNLNATFNWNSADGFSNFSLLAWDETSGAWQPANDSALRWFAAIQVEPLLRGYFKLNDWQRMNGSLRLRATRIVPVMFPFAPDGQELTLEDPDETSLMHAVAAGDLKVVEMLLGANDKPDKDSRDVDALNQSGETALILACKSPNMKAGIVKALLVAGADINLRSRTGYTALTWAQVRNNREVIRILRKAGAKP
jgi:Ankyrin repeats (3 copies)